MATSGKAADIEADQLFRYMGIYVVFVSNGAHLAAVVGGFTALNLGYRWCYWVSTAEDLLRVLTDRSADTCYHPRNYLACEPLLPARDTLPS